MAEAWGIRRQAERVGKSRDSTKSVCALRQIQCELVFCYCVKIVRITMDDELVIGLVGCYYHPYNQKSKFYHDSIKKERTGRDIRTSELPI
jgi:hypothetical protein